MIVVAAALTALYRWTPFGLATRAASENEAAAMLSGLSPSRLAIANTVLACVVAGGLGVLVAPLIALDAQTLAFQVVPALAAALLAGFTSFFIACFAGLAIGAIQALLIYWSTQGWFPTDSSGTPIHGLPELFVFLVVVLALFLRGASLPGRGELVEKRLPAVPRPERLLRPSAIAAVVGVVALIVFPYDFRQATINSMLGIAICLSLVVIVGFVGQISVVQLALAGVAGFTMSHLTTDVGGIWAEFPISLLIGAATATVVGLLIAISALRVRGVSLVVVTLAAAVALEQFGFLNERWGGQAAGSPVEQPKLGGLDLSPNAGFRGLDDKIPSPVFGFLVLAGVILMALLVANVRRSSLGQRMLAVRSNERAAAAAGINVRNTKLAGFGIAAFVAGMAGALYAYNFGSVSYSRFGALAALALIAFTYFGGITMVSGAIIAGIGATEGLLPHGFDEWLGLSGNWAFLIGGIALIVTLLVNPEGIAGTGYTKKMQKRKRLAAEAAARPGPAAMRSRGRPRGRSARHPVRRGRKAAPWSSSATGISVSFGGLQGARRRRPHGDRGPARRSDRPERRGQDDVHRRHLGLRPVPRQRRARRARTRRAARPRARRPRPREDVAVARAVRRPERAREPRGRLVPPLRVGDGQGDALAAGEDARRQRTRRSSFSGSSTWPTRCRRSSPRAQRKLVGIGRALAAEPRLLCLDEPAAGLDAREGEALAHHLREVVDAGTPLLLVDHDMGLVLGISDYVVVLEFGKVIAQGPPEAVRRDPLVVKAYLGSAASELQPAVDAS